VYEFIEGQLTGSISQLYKDWIDVVQVVPVPTGTIIH
jgi:hypothetical protein